jgi:predicted phosphodiesterase
MPLHCVCPQGDFDDPPLTKDTPEYVVVKLGNFRIGVIHGHQVRVPSIIVWREMPGRAL